MKYESNLQNNLTTHNSRFGKIALRLSRTIKILTIALMAGVIMSQPVNGHAAEQGNPKILIVYFSHTQNTETVAKHIQSIVGGNLLELKTVRQYPANHDETVRIAVQENRSNARPELATVFPENMDDYDIIFAGYPVWEYTMPMALFSFFDRYKFPGKTIIPFSTHLGSRLAGGPRDIAKLCPQAKLMEGLAIRGPNAAGSKAAVAEWLNELGLIDAR